MSRADLNELEAPFPWRSASMRLDTRPGETVRFLGENGREAELAEAMGVLTPGAAYTVRRMIVRDWSSLVVLDEGCFNSVMFTNEEGGSRC